MQSGAVIAGHAPPALDQLRVGMEAVVDQYSNNVKSWVEGQEQHLQQKRSALEEGEALLRRQKQDFAEKEATFEREKEALAKVVNSSEVVEFNVGGGIFTARRSTLCQYDSMLSAMFSGRWDDAKFGRDSAGRMYIELNRECFQVVLEWLRSRIIDPRAPVPVPPRGMETMYKSTVDFLQLEELQAEDQYYKVTNQRLKSISSRVTGHFPLTDVLDFNSTNCKTIGKCKVGEVVKLLKGPVYHEASGTTRIFARSCKDGVEGWLTQIGNTGITSLEKCRRPLNSDRCESA
jgi:hypothetical protein